MIYHPTEIPGVMIIDLEPIADARGFFARAFCRDDFAAHGLDFEPIQANLSQNHRKGTLRGLHYQEAPHQEDKLVRAVSGAIFDVAVDLRPDSPAYGRWTGVTLSSENRRAFFVPKGCAHGYQTLEDQTEVLYLVSAAYQPGAGRGLRWDDPALAIDWPQNPPGLISPQDAAWANFSFRPSKKT